MDPSVHYRNLAAGYTEGIRNTDAKAFIGVLFTAIMASTVIGYRSLFPAYLTPPLYVTPFLVIFFLLLFCVYPRYPRSGRARFPLLRNADPETFLIALDKDGENQELPLRCAILARILYWKTITLQISYAIAMMLIIAGEGLMCANYFWPSMR